MFQRRTGSAVDLHAHLARQDQGHGGLAQARWTAQQHVIERLVTLLRGLHVDAQLFLELALTHEVVEVGGTQREVVFAVVRRLNGRHLALGCFSHRTGFYHACRAFALRYASAESALRSTASTGCVASSPATARSASPREKPICTRASTAIISGSPGPIGETG